MRRHLLIAAGLLALLSPAKAADSTVTALTAASALGGTELFYVVQGGADRKATPAQIDTYVRSLMGTGVSTWLNTPSSANLAAALTDKTGTGLNVFATSPTLVTPNLGTPSTLVGTNITGTASGLTAGNVTTNANLTGMVTSVGNAASLGSFTSANLATALTDETGSGANVFGTAPTISSLNATTAMTLAFLTGGGTQCLQVSNTGVVSATGAVCGGSGASGANPTATAGDVAVNGVASTFLRSDGAPAIQKGSSSLFGIVKVDNTTIVANAGVISSGGVAVNLQTGTNYAIVAGDFGKLVQLSNASNQTPTLPIASTTGANWVTNVCNIGAGIQTITPTTSTIGGAATYVLRGGSAAAPVCVTIQSDGTNYNVIPAAPATVASGTSALGTGAISSATCATVVTTSATGTATTDVVWWGFNGDPTAVTGYTPVTSGALTIFAYPSANNVNFKVCNLTTGSITPGAITLNWRIVR